MRQSCGHRDAMIAELTALVPSLLARAESIFGPREPGWSLPTLALHPAGPLLDCSSTPNALTIYLDLTESSSFDQGIYQLTHEIVHCLDPVHPPPATMLEEGMCVWFSLYGMPFRHPDYLRISQERLETNLGSADYRDALRPHNELMALDARAIRLIRNAGRINDSTPETLRAAVPAMSHELARRLCERREMR